MNIMDKKRRILIIGAGASGMSAALSAAKNGALVTVAEHNSEAGKKILITGNGRCNYTNTFVSPEHYRCNDKKLIGSVLASFGYDDCIKLFKGLGIEPNVIHYRFDEKGLTVSQDGDVGELPWVKIYKLVATKHNVLVYNSRITAYVIPREQLTEEQFKELKRIIYKNLPKPNYSDRFFN